MNERHAVLHDLMDRHIALCNIINGRNVFFRRSIFQFRTMREPIVQSYLDNERQILNLMTMQRMAERPLTINIPIQAPANFFDPIPVLASAEEIDDALESFEDSPTLSCAVCQDALASSAVRLRHCQHHFHSSCIRQWFETSVRCPVCRHDIREGQVTETSADETRTTPHEDHP